MVSGEGMTCDKCGDERKCDETPTKPKCVKDNQLAVPSDGSDAKCQVS